jgi:hypothetical protein
MGRSTARRFKLTRATHTSTTYRNRDYRADRPVSVYAVKTSDVAIGGRLYRGADTADADGFALLTPESGRRSQIPPEAVEICYDGHLPATARADIQRTPPC